MAAFGHVAAQHLQDRFARVAILDTDPGAAVAVQTAVADTKLIVQRLQEIPYQNSI